VRSGSRTRPGACMMGPRSGPHRTPRFMQDLKKLMTQQRQRFESTVIIQFVVDLKIGRFHPGLRIKRVQVTPNGPAVEGASGR